MYIDNIDNIDKVLFELAYRDPLRQGASDEELLGIISNAVNHKKRKHAGNYNFKFTKIISLASNILRGPL